MAGLTGCATMGNSVGYKSVDDLKGQPLGSVDRCEVFSVGAETMQAAARYGFEQSDLEILEESALDGGGWQVIGKGRSKKGNGELVRLVVIPGGEPDSPTTEVAYKAIKRFELNITEDLEGVRNRVFANLDEFLVARELRGDGTRPTSFLDVKALEAARLRTGTPEAAWQTLSKYPEMDEVILLPDDRIIVGFLEMWMSHFPYAQSMAPYYATYAMYDGKTGERVWSHSRFDKPERQYQVVASYPHVAYVRIDDSSTKIVCLGLDDGEKQWQRSWSSRRVAFTLNGDATILFAAVWEKSLTVEAIDLSNGKVLWQKEVAADRAPQPFVVENDQLLVGASSLTSFDPATGRIVWTANGAGEIAPPSTLIVLEDGFVVPGRSGTVTRLDLAGNLVWQTP
ncbi:MAG: PQQ-binding-like beta-propeller repeat protein, partial [Nitrospirota bacterium]